MVYEHVGEALEWMGVDTERERRNALRNRANHGGSEAAGMLSAYENKTREAERLAIATSG